MLTSWRRAEAKPRLGGIVGLLCALLLPSSVAAVERSAAERAEARTAEAITISDALWRLAEVGYQETESSALLQDHLRRAGFAVSEGTADIPTAFVAEYGSGKPVIGILAEFDALPGLSQSAQPQRSPLEEDGAGHACGHHMFGAASVTAAMAIADWLKSTGQSGTVKLYGTPAEEGGSGKVYIARSGAFDGVDAVLHWHPSDRNEASPATTTANKSGRFVFKGQAAHAAAAPERGRSALDGVEAMNYMVNLLREHVPEKSRIHYVITDGGDAPNIVPERAAVYYYVRHPEAQQVERLFERVTTIAQAAASGTNTEVAVEVMHGNHPVLPNEILARLVDGKMRELADIRYSSEERRFAREIRKSLLGSALPLGSQQEVQPFQFKQTMGSTDVGDVSWLVPTVGFNTATWVPGTPAHSWQAVAAGGMSIGHKGMVLAARILAATAQELYLDGAVLQQAWREFEERRGADFEYRALLGDRQPPLDYRN